MLCLDELSHQHQSEFGVLEHQHDKTSHAVTLHRVIDPAARPYCSSMAVRARSGAANAGPKAWTVRWMTGVIDDPL